MISSCRISQESHLSGCRGFCIDPNTTNCKVAINCPSILTPNIFEDVDWRRIEIYGCDGKNYALKSNGGSAIQSSEMGDGQPLFVKHQSFGGSESEKGCIEPPNQEPSEKGWGPTENSSKMFKGQKRMTNISCKGVKYFFS